MANEPIHAPLPRLIESGRSANPIVPIVILGLAVASASTSCATVRDIASMNLQIGMYEQPSAEQIDWIKKHGEDPSTMVADILRCDTGVNCVALVPIGERDNNPGAVRVENEILEKTASEGLIQAFFIEMDDTKYQADVDTYLQTGKIPTGSNLEALFKEAEASIFGQHLISSLTSQFDIARKYGLDVVCVDLDVGGYDTTAQGIAERDMHIQARTAEYFQKHPGAKGIMRLGAVHIRNSTPLVSQGVGFGINIHTIEIMTPEISGLKGNNITAVEALKKSGIAGPIGIRDVAGTPFADVRNDFHDADSTLKTAGIGSIIITPEENTAAPTQTKKITKENKRLTEILDRFYKMMIAFLFGTDISHKEKQDLLALWMSLPKENQRFVLTDEDKLALQQLLQEQERKKRGVITPAKDRGFYERQNKKLHSPKFTGSLRM